MAPFELQVRTPIDVNVYHLVGSTPAISLVGNDGNAPKLFDPGQAASAPKDKSTDGDGSGALPDLPSSKMVLSRREFGPKIGPTASLTIKVNVDPTAEGAPAADANKAGGKGNSELTFTRTYTIENLYRGALRLGVALPAWAPWARTLAVRSTQGGAKYAAVDSGAPVGLFGVEIVAGYSFFLGEAMSDLHYRTGPGWNISLGVLKAGMGGVTGISSLRTGPEISFGLDGSVALTAGIERHDFPTNDIHPNAALPSGTTSINTAFGLTPGFGVVFNFTPGILKSLGLSAGSGAS